MARTDLSKNLLSRYERLEGQRQNWETHWQEVADYMQPRKADVTKQRARGDKRMEQVFDSSPIQAVELLAASLHGMLTNPSTPWFTLRFKDVEIDNEDEAKLWLEASTEAMYTAFNRSNFQQEIFELYHDLITFGTAAMFIEEDDDDIIKFSTRHINEVFIAESILDIIFNKSITQHTYAHLYSKLLVTLISILGDDFKIDLLNKIKSFYKNNIEKEFSESSYDEICSGNKNKYKLLGNFIFMGELYINNIIDKVVILHYLEILFNCSFNSKDIDNLDRYIESLLNLIKTIGLKLENEIKEEFIGLVIDKLKTITSNKDRFKSRLRFLVMDIIDLHKSKWII